MEAAATVAACLLADDMYRRAERRAGGRRPDVVRAIDFMVNTDGSRGLFEGEGRESSGCFQQVLYCKGLADGDV